MNLEALKAVQGSSIKSVTGTVTSLAGYKYEEQGEHGPSSFQPGKFKLESGEVVALVFKNQFERNGGDLKRLLNKTVTLASHSGDRGLTGVKVGEYKNAVQLVVTATAEIIEASGNGTSAPAAPATNAPAKGAPSKPAPAKMDEKAALLAAKKFVARNGTLCRVALAAVEALERAYIEQRKAAGDANCVGFDPLVFNTFLNSHLFGSSHNGWYDALPLNVTYPKLEIVVHTEGSQ